LWYRGKYTNLVTLTFSRIEGIISDNLPIGALRKEDWWHNNKTSSQGYAWTSVGWRVQRVDLKERTVTFKREVKGEPKQTSKRRRKRVTKTRKPFTPVPVKPRRIHTPSKTRIAKVIARARNIERRKATAPYKARLKPKSTYEKKLYDPEAKPTAHD
jgi:hypothetical protein